MDIKERERPVYIIYRRNSDPKKVANPDIDPARYVIGMVYDKKSAYKTCRLLNQKLETISNNDWPRYFVERKVINDVFELDRYWLKPQTLMFKATLLRPHEPMLACYYPQHTATYTRMLVIKTIPTYYGWHNEAYIQVPIDTLPGFKYNDYVNKVRKIFRTIRNQINYRVSMWKDIYESNPIYLISKGFKPYHHHNYNRWMAIYDHIIHTNGDIDHSKITLHDLIEANSIYTPSELYYEPEWWKSMFYIRLDDLGICKKNRTNFGKALLM